MHFGWVAWWVSESLFHQRGRKAEGLCAPWRAVKTRPFFVLIVMALGDISYLTYMYWHYVCFESFMIRYHWLTMLCCFDPVRSMMKKLGFSEATTSANWLGFESRHARIWFISLVCVKVLEGRLRFWCTHGACALPASVGQMVFVTCTAVNKQEVQNGCAKKVLAMYIAAQTLLES